MYSTWFSLDPRGYCDLNLRLGCASALYRGMGTTLLPDSDECCEEMPVPVEGVLDFELGSDVRSGSEPMAPPLALGGIGERDGLVE